LYSRNVVWRALKPGSRGVKKQETMI